MKHSPDELPESARHAFDSYPRLEPSRAFNRAVLEALALEQSKRKRTLIGRIEEFLGLGLWQFAGSGALGALFPALVLGVLMLSGQAPAKAPTNHPVAPFSWPGLSPFDTIRRQQLMG